MKKHLTTITIITAMIMAAWIPARAEMTHDMQGASHSGQMGKLIHESNMEGYHLSYNLIDMKERMKSMEGMKGMKMGMAHDMGTHHLMVHIQTPKGELMISAKVGYMVIGPDGAKQMAMAMGMRGGFGADLSLKEKGTYQIRTKIMAGGKKMMDKFDYTVK